MNSGLLQGTLNSPLGKPPSRVSKPPTVKVRSVVPPAVAPAAISPATATGPQAAAAPTNLVENKQYDVATDESCASISFVWDDGKREVGLPYVHLTLWNRSDMEVTFNFGNIEARVKFDADFPLATLLMNFRFQRVATIYEIPGKVKIVMVKIDEETGASSPL